MRSVVVGGLTIAYDERVLAPRPWTELQGRWAAELAATVPEGPILELFAGVGHIGLVAADGCGRALVQVDANPAACELARRNAAAAGIRVDVRCGRIDEALDPDERYPLVLADPPYLPTDALGDFPDDPAIAVDGGADGLDLARAAVAVVDRVLLPGGEALLQLWGRAQVERLVEQLPPGLRAGEVREDGPDRAVVAILRSEGRPGRRDEGHEGGGHDGGGSG